jgi:hypothetical protein
MQAKTLPTPFQGIKPVPPGTPPPAPDLSDMDHIHKMIATGALADILTRIAGKKR